MSKRSHVLIIALLLLAVPSLTLMADSASAVLYATGQVNVNGSAVNRSVSVFDGDTIHTAANSAGTLALKGTSIVVQGGSTVVFTRGGLRLNTGAASVKTSQGMTASVGAFLVAPSEMTGRFTVLQSGSKLTVAALEGGLTVTGAGKNFAVKPGTSLSLSLDATSQGPQTDTSGGTNIALIAAVAAAVAAGVISAVIINQQSSSPVGP